MEVRFEVAEEHLRVLVAALHCLAQVGKELALECDGGTRALTCRALNDAHSASGTITFARAFFASVHISSSTGSGRSDVVPFAKCKVYAKPCCNVFRTLKHVRSAELVLRVDDEQLQELSSQLSSHADEDERMGLELDVDCAEIEWRLRCDFDVTKTHRMKVHASQVMRAVFDRESCAHRLVTRQHHLASLLAHIHHSSEVCVTCTATHAKFESYAAGGADGKAHLHTETAVESVEFNEYALAPRSQGIDSSVQLIFTLKEVRALLAFCKACDILEVAFYFSAGGSPVLFAAESTSTAKVSAEITLSTITTFLPASSQARSEDELPYFHQATGAAASTGEEAKESDSSQSSVRYLTHSSKRPRVD